MAGRMSDRELFHQSHRRALGDSSFFLSHRQRSLPASSSSMEATSWGVNALHLLVNADMTASGAVPDTDINLAKGGYRTVISVMHDRNSPPVSVPYTTRLVFSRM